MSEVLLVIDMQNDFIDGSLGTKEAVGIVENVKKKIENFNGPVFFTRDTHFEDYLVTQEGKNLPVVHCVKNTFGWQIRKEIDELRTTKPVDKLTFGSTDLPHILKGVHKMDPISTITLVGLCTDICIISNALITKAALPEVEIVVDASCCAGVTPQSHKNALEAMKMCQIKVINE